MEKPKSKSAKFKKTQKQNKREKKGKKGKSKREKLVKKLICPFAFFCIYFAFSICLFVLFSF